MTTTNLPILTDRTRRILDETGNHCMYTQKMRVIRDENGKFIGCVPNEPTRPCTIVYSTIDGTIYQASYGRISYRQKDLSFIILKSDEKGVLPDEFHEEEKVEELFDSVRPPQVDYAVKRVLEQILVWRSEIE